MYKALTDIRLLFKSSCSSSPPRYGAARQNIYLHTHSRLVFRGAWKGVARLRHHAPLPRSSTLGVGRQGHVVAPTIKSCEQEPESQHRPCRNLSRKLTFSLSAPLRALQCRQQLEACAVSRRGPP